MNDWWYMNKEKIIIVSGYEPGVGGVGQLVKALQNIMDEKNVSFFFKRSFSIKAKFKKKQYAKFIFFSFLRFLFNFLFYVRVRLLRNAKVLLVHPQRIGFKLCKKIIVNNDVYFYIVDNSFFCMRSYNTSPVSNSECFSCLGDLDPLKQCFSSPVKYKTSVNLDFLAFLKLSSSHINFLVQNAKQKELVLKHFKKTRSVNVIGLPLSEMDLYYDKDVKSVYGEEIKSYDFVFHANPSIEKGLLFFVELASKLDKYTFMVPTSKDNCQSVLGNDINLGLSNLYFVDCTWRTGLGIYLANCRIACNPSCWSAPIEGALIKSLIYAPLVLVIESQYAFSSELNLKKLIVVPNSPNLASKKIESVFESKSKIIISSNPDPLDFVSSPKKGDFYHNLNKIIEKNC